MARVVDHWSDPQPRKLGFVRVTETPANDLYLTQARLVEWVHRYADGLRRYVWSQVRDRTRAEDLVQEVFLRAWRRRDAYVHDGREQAFLFRIADRLVIDQHRGRRREQSWGDTFDPMDPRTDEAVNRITVAEDRDRLVDAMNTLSEAQRRVLLLRYFGEMTFAEIAQAMECPLGTALSHAKRGLARIRELLADQPDDSEDGSSVEGERCSP